MAMSLRGLLRNNMKFLTSSILKPATNNANRSIYSPSSLAIDSYCEHRKNVAHQFESVSQSFRDKMKEFANEESKSIIFTEDLKAMLHLVENKPEDIELIMKMVKKFHTQNSELRFGNYVFGPVVMRLFYFLDAPDAALQAFKDPQLQGFFDQLTSYQILMTLLYNHGRFQEMREVYDLIKAKYTGGIMHPQNSIILVLAACLRENTPESFQYALDLWRDLQQKGFEPNRKSVCLLAALALKQGKPEFTLELISSSPQFRHIDVRCLKIQAYTELDRLDDVVQFMNKILYSDRFNTQSNKVITFFKDIIEKLEEAVNRKGKEENEKLVRMLDELRSQKSVEDKTLEESLLRTIDRRRTDNRQYSSSRPLGSNNRGGYQRQRTEMRY